MPVSRFYFSVFSLFAINSLPAQITELTAPGDGANLYYVVNVPSPAFVIPASSSIYKIGSQPATLFLSFPPPVLPPAPGATGSIIFYLSDYYLVSHPQFSRDGSVFAYTGKRICLGGQQCAFLQRDQTTVQGTPGQGIVRISGSGWLSGNGRYFLEQTGLSTPDPSLSLVDLQTSLIQLIAPGVAVASASGRLLADDGTAVFTNSFGVLYVFRGSTLKTPASGVSEAVIDAAGRDILYTAMPPGSALHLYRPAENRDTILVQGLTGIHAPALSADGQRAMFLSSGQPGISDPTPQLYTTNIDGSRFFQITNEASGVVRYAMSDDGQVAWYVTGDGSLVKLNLFKSSTVFHVAAVDLSNTLVPGSATTLGGVALAGGVRITVGGIPAPLLSVSPSNIVFQVPWETPVGQPVNIQVVTHADTNAEGTAQGSVTPLLSKPALLLPDPVFAGGRAIHQDWSGFVTRENPARIGEIVYFYGTGFGPVQPPVPTGAPAPANPPAALATPLSCNMPVVYAGLAPGLIGYYQINVQVEVPPPDPEQFLYLSGLPFSCGQGVIASIPFSSR